MSRGADFSPGDLSRIVEMAWQDHIPFEALQQQFGLSESAVIACMRSHLKKSSFHLWRQRVNGRGSKHLLRAASLVAEDVPLDAAQGHSVGE